MSRNAQNLTLNENNVVRGTYNTKYEHTFNSVQSFVNKEIALTNLQIYYSWYNINSRLYNNNSLQYKWFDTTGNLTQTYSIVFSDGFYDVTSINLYIQSVLKARGHYFKPSVNTLSPIYHISVRDNPTYYSFEIVLTKIPIALPDSYQPLSGWALPSVATFPQVIINSTNNFGKLIGFTPQTIPLNVTAEGVDTYTIQSNLVPVISPITSLVMRCNLARNDIASPNDIIYTFSQGNESYGSLLNISPNNLIWTKVASGQYNSISVQFYDQNYNPIEIKDSQLIMNLVIRDIA